MVGHAHQLRGAPLPGVTDPEGRPTVVSILEQDFMPWFLDRMRSAEGRAELAGRDAFAAARSGGVARLFQPVHKTFNIVLVEVHCLTDGEPRLDPKKVLKAGAVVRRLSGGGPVGWIKREGQILGWRSLPGDAVGAAPRWDPEAAVRRTAQQGKNRVVMRHAAPLSAETAGYEEEFAPLYPAPPEVCASIGRTVLFGYLPVTSGERSEADPPPAAPFDDADVDARLPAILWRQGRTRATTSEAPATPPATKRTVRAEDAAAPDDALATVIAGVNYLAQEPGLFTPVAEGAPDPADALKRRLRGIQVQLDGEDRTRTLLWFLERANRVLVRREEGLALRLPQDWPDISAATERALVRDIKAAMTARWVALSPGETRYQTLSAQYEIQAFARIDRSDCGCPPETVWTPPSAPLRIVPWYESGDAPPNVVELPAPTADFMAQLKPNVAFKVPEEIQQFMSGIKLDDLAEGKKPGPKLGFGMICGFSIPIITICAFIVLQIFLALFHILFWWLPFIRICIPFPKPPTPPPGG